MTKVTLQTLGLRLKEQRGERGIRSVAEEIGVSHATLSRVERGFLPDLGTFSKICQWLNVDPGEVLGTKAKVSSSPEAAPSVSIHFRKDVALSERTARALANAIMLAPRNLAQD